MISTEYGEKRKIRKRESGARRYRYIWKILAVEKRNLWPLWDGRSLDEESRFIGKSFHGRLFGRRSGRWFGGGKSVARPG